MGKGRVTALLLAVVVIGLAVMRTATASHTGDHFAFSGGTGFRGLVVKTDRASTSITTNLSSWQTVDSRSFQIPAGESQLIVVDFLGRVDCDTALCLARPVVGRTLETAQELEPGLGVNSVLGTTGVEEFRAFSRSQCVRNATGSPLNVSVWLQATRDLVGSAAYDLSGWTLKIARNAPCSPSVDI